MKAKVVALFKSGDESNCDNYRPISILPTISKIIERAVHKQFYEFLQVNNLLFKDQFGFRNKTSTSSALLQFTDNLLKSMDVGHVPCVLFVYLDLKKSLRYSGSFFVAFEVDRVWCFYRLSEMVSLLS